MKRIKRERTRIDATRSERARMGGDWAVCCVLLTRRIRDVVRWSFLFRHKCFGVTERSWERSFM